MCLHEPEGQKWKILNGMMLKSGLMTKHQRGLMSIALNMV